ncbi:unnamed protein product [Psylliodes chrysocephalus]|uniref:Glutathione S-transferase n=1 Tax=Psylliodes chrysocephalus TaxID=3402493 RepID=A0A9P0CEJ0_9CUCU|nr:unnamed protein product [Psylliodes chrysocephala]
MAPNLYYMSASPAARSVDMCTKAIGLDLNIIEVDLRKGAHLSAEYLKLNPQHTVPLLDDDGFVLADSHAIMTYLVSKYGKDETLYPKDLKQRAIVDHRLHFDSNILYVRGLLIGRSLLFEGAKSIDPKLLASLEEAFSITEQFLERSKYVAGDQLTIADFSFVTCITSWSGAFAPLTEDKFPKICAWIKKMQQLPYYRECNQVGLDIYLGAIKDKLSK